MTSRHARVSRGLLFVLIAASAPAWGGSRGVLAPTALAPVPAPSEDAFAVWPRLVQVEVGECETASSRANLRVPADPLPPKADVYLLADATGSMEPVIDGVQADATELVGGLVDELEGVDLRFGVGQYRDFPADEFVFDHMAFSREENEVIGAIGDWTAWRGGDSPEGQLYALDRIARDADPAGGPIGWRADAEKIVVWFGDAPGHDPVCDAWTGDGDVTEGSVVFDLRAGDMSVVAISTVTGREHGLDDDPTRSTWAYDGICPKGGRAGQATRIADQTGGVHVAGADGGNIADIIADQVQANLRRIDRIELAARGDVAPFFEGGTVVSGDGVVGPARFALDARWTGDRCEEPGPHHGWLDVLADGVAVASQRVVVTCD